MLLVAFFLEWKIVTLLIAMSGGGGSRGTIVIELGGLLEKVFRDTCPGSGGTRWMGRK